VEVRGAAVTVRQIAAETVATGDMTAHVIPLPGQFVSAELTRRASGPSLRISECQRARPHEFETVAGVKGLSRGFRFLIRVIQRMPALCRRRVTSDPSQSTDIARPARPVRFGPIGDKLSRGHLLTLVVDHRTVPH
jgi:hypothetical protein